MSPGGNGYCVYRGDPPRSADTQTRRRAVLKEQPGEPVPNALPLCVWCVSLQARYEGARVRKLFDDEYYEGTIDEVWAEEGSAEIIVHVVFDDGDQEDLDLSEIDALLIEKPKPKQKPKPKEKPKGKPAPKETVGKKSAGAAKQPAATGLDADSESSEESEEGSSESSEEGLSEEEESEEDEPLLQTRPPKPPQQPPKPKQQKQPQPQSQQKQGRVVVELLSCEEDSSEEDEPLLQMRPSQPRQPPPKPKPPPSQQQPKPAAKPAARPAAKPAAKPAARPANGSDKAPKVMGKNKRQEEPAAAVSKRARCEPELRRRPAMPPGHPCHALGGYVPEPLAAHLL